MRAKKIKEKYLSTKVFKDDGAFDCGSQIAYEMEQDLAAMKVALRHIENHLESIEVKTFGGQQAVLAKELLEKRIKEFE